MKGINLKKHIPLLLLACALCSSAQQPGKMFHQVMEQRMQRSMETLRLPGMPDPFYIGLNLVDQNRFVVHSILGSTINVDETRIRFTQNLQVLTGSYQANNLNGPYMRRPGGTISLPVGDCVDEIRRRLWLGFDNEYKMSANLYSAKQSANQNASMGEWDNVSDYLPGSAIQVDHPVIELNYDHEKLAQYTNAISASMKAYSGLTWSWVRLTGTKANIYHANTEGAKATYPSSIFRLVVNAETLSGEGEKLEIYNTYHVKSESELPPLKQVLKETEELVAVLMEMKNAPVFSGNYNGPVLFEGPAASEVVRKTMFYAKHENLYAKREPLSARGKTGPGSTNILTESRIGNIISNEGLTVKACPKKTEYQGISLIGYYPVDMEGTVPPDEVVLIRDGVLENLLCGRTPTLKMKESNGHLRVPYYSGIPVIAPGVIEVGFKNAVSREELRKQLIERAKAEGLDYAIIVREMTSNLSVLRRVYKVDVETGKETMVRSVGFNSLELGDLRKIIGASHTMRVLNTTSGEDTNHRFDYMSGCPATFISPDAFLFRDLEISKSTNQNLNKMPVVKHPAAL